MESNRGLDRIALRERTMGDVFAAAGYRTGYVGKWHSGLHDRRYHPNRRGFAEFAGFLSGIMDYWNWFLDYNGASRRADGRYQTDVFTAEAADFIQRSAARRTAPGHTSRSARRLAHNRDRDTSSENTASSASSGMLDVRDPETGSSSATPALALALGHLRQHVHHAKFPQRCFSALEQRVIPYSTRQRSVTSFL